MSFNRIRRLVSGKKARFVTEDGLELDLAYITDRIIICGLPAHGIEALYRNDRHSVRQFLSGRYGEHYRIFNFCPRFENSYDAAYFNNQVSRYPFPDHHPPPLSLVPLAVRRMHDWLSEDEQNVIVIHCKAGKGRSGTMCCCYLLSLPALPPPPSLPQNISANAKGKQSANHTASEAHADSSIQSSTISTPQNSDSEDDVAAPPRSQSGGAAMDLEGMRGEKRHQSGRAKISKLVENLASSGDENGITDDETGKAGEPMAANKEASDIADKLNEVFNLHTSQRMKPSSLVKQGDEVEHQPAKKPVRGVSIPSQRRFVGYWSRVLTKQDPRPLNLLAPPKLPHNERNRRQAHIAEIRVYMPEQMPGFPGIISKKNLSVHLGRYKTGFVDELERQDLDLREMRRLEKRERKEGALSPEEASKLKRLKNDWNNWDDDNWDDKAKMFEDEGVLIEARDGIDKSDATSNGSGFRRLVPKHDDTSVSHRIAVDADREVQLKILVGDSGKKHSLLPDVSSLGYIWLIPSFHLEAPPQEDRPASLKYSIVLDNSEIDFFKTQSGIEKVEIDFEWTVY